MQPVFHPSHHQDHDCVSRDREGNRIDSDVARAGPDRSREPDAVMAANDDAIRRGEAPTLAPVRHPRIPEAA